MGLYCKVVCIANHNRQNAIAFESLLVYAAIDCGSASLEALVGTGQV